MRVSLLGFWPAARAGRCLFRRAALRWGLRAVAWGGRARGAALRLRAVAVRLAAHARAPSFFSGVVDRLVDERVQSLSELKE